MFAGDGKKLFVSLKENGFSSLKKNVIETTLGNINFITYNKMN